MGGLATPHTVAQQLLPVHGVLALEPVVPLKLLKVPIHGPLWLGLTVNDTAAVCEVPPLVPVMVMVTVPVVVVLVVAMGRVDDPDPLLIEVGLKLAVAPEGKPLALNATALLNPLVGLTDAVYVALLPAVTVADEGDADSEKSGGCEVCTVKVTLTECERPAPLSAPVMVTV